MSSNPSGSGGRPNERPAPQIPDHELLRLIGSGAYGEVWLARSALNAWRAIKVVHRADFSEARPYEREMEGIRHFEPVSRTHENLVDILQFGHNKAEGWFYYVMELADPLQQDLAETSDGTDLKRGECATPETQVTAEGGEQSGSLGDTTKSGYSPRTLRDELKQRGRLPFSECLELGMAMARALGHLHRRRLVHRDIKPSNIIFVGGIPKLADIGLVTALDETQSLVGTHGYVPPEGPGTPRADLFSLGKVLFVAATGKEGRHYPEPLTELASLPEASQLLELDQVIQKACANDPSARYASAEEMVADLALLQSGASLRKLRQNDRWLRRLKRIGLAAVGVGILGVAGYFYERNHALRLGRVAAEGRDHLVRLHLAQGRQHMDAEDLFAALPWFVEAAKLAQEPDEKELHRQRVEAVLRQCPTLMALGRHLGPVNSAEFSANGQFIVSTSDDGTARVWNSADGAPVTAPLVHGQPVNDARFSPSGRLVVTGSADQTARVWLASTGEAAIGPLVHEGSVGLVGFSHDEQWILTGCEGGAARLWSSATGHEVCQMRHEKALRCALFSPDGKSIATTSDDQTARIWRVPSGDPLTQPLPHPSRVRWAAFSPDGTRLATACDDGKARIWNVSSGTEMLSFSVAPQVLYVAYSPDGRHLLTCGGDENRWGEGRVWDAMTGQAVSPPLRHSGRVKHAAFSPDGLTVATASHDGSARLWETKSGNPIGPILQHHRPVWSVVFSPDGNALLTASKGELWRLWDLNVREWANPALPIEVNDSLIERLSSGEETANASVAYHAAVALCSLFGPPFYSTILQHRTNTFRVAADWDTMRVATGGTNGLIRIWSLSTSRLVLPPMDHGASVLCLAFSPDGRWLATGGEDGLVRIWDLVTGAEARITPIRQDEIVWYVAYSPDGQRIVTGSTLEAKARFTAMDGPGIIRVWSAVTGRFEVEVWRHHPEHATLPVLFSPDGRRLLFGCVGGSEEAIDAHLVDAFTGQPVCAPLMHRGNVLCAAFDPPGKQLATGSSDGTVKLWDAVTGAPGPPIRGHSQCVNSIVFSPDGRRLLTGGFDGVACLWDTRTGESLGPPLRHFDLVTEVRFSPDGQHIVTASGVIVLAKLRIWEYPLPTFPIQRLDNLGMLLSGVRLDPRIGPIELTAMELESIWRRTKSKLAGLSQDSRSP